MNCSLNAGSSQFSMALVLQNDMDKIYLCPISFTFVVGVRRSHFYLNFSFCLIHLSICVPSPAEMSEYSMLSRSTVYLNICRPISSFVFGRSSSQSISDSFREIFSPVHIDEQSFTRVCHSEEDDTFIMYSIQTRSWTAHLPLSIISQLTFHSIRTGNRSW